MIYAYMYRAHVCILELHGLDPYGEANVQHQSILSEGLRALE